MTKKKTMLTPEVNQHIAELSETDIEVCTLLANHFEVYLDEMFSIGRKRDCVYCRHLYARWQRKNTMRSLEDIGSKVRVLPIDHTTVLHSIDTANSLIETDRHVRFIWDAIKNIKPPERIANVANDPAWVKTKVDNRHLIAQCE
jgi:chromosomal replication initiation ATPase DnaA